MPDPKPPHVKRLYEVIYGDTDTIGWEQSIGGAGTWQLDRGLRVFDGETETILEFDALYDGVAADDTEEFLAELAQFRERMTTPFQRVRLRQGTVEDPELDLDPVTNTGFNAIAEIDKKGSDDDTITSRRVSCRITVEKPADRASRVGRRDSQTEIVWTGARVAQVTFTGVWTALNANGALAQYQAEVEGWVTSQLSGLAGTWPDPSRPDEESATPDANDKTLEFRRVYRQIIRAESGSALDDPDLSRPELRITRVRTGPGDALIDLRVAERLTAFDVDFSCEVNVDLATDLEAKWTSDILPHVVDRLQEIFGLAELGIVSEGVTLGDDSNALSGRIQFLGAESDLIEAEEEVLASVNFGRPVRRTWGPTKRSGYKSEVPELATVSVRTRLVELDAGARGVELVRPQAGVHQGRDIKVKRTAIGIRRLGPQIRIRETIVEDRYQLYDPVDPGEAPETSSGNETVVDDEGGGDQQQSIADVFGLMGAEEIAETAAQRERQFEAERASIGFRANGDFDEFNG